MKKEQVNDDLNIRLRKMSKQAKEYKHDAEWYEALYWAKIVAFNMLKDAWKAHDRETDWDMIDKIARNIIIKIKPDYDKC